MTIVSTNTHSPRVPKSGSDELSSNFHGSFRVKLILRANQIYSGDFVAFLEKFYYAWRAFRSKDH
jgi:hypothetical protein